MKLLAITLVVLGAGQFLLSINGLLLSNKINRLETKPVGLTRAEIALECQRLSAQTIDKFREQDGKRVVWNYNDCVRQLMDANNLLPASLKTN